MTDDAETSRGTLRRIADILGVPLESFLDGSPPEPLNGTSQCLILWQSIKCPTRRRKALDYLCELAEDEVAQAEMRDVQVRDVEVQIGEVQVGEVRVDDVKGSEPLAIGVASRKD